jgi:hypothetical protein
LAAEHGTTIGRYVGELARAQRTHAEWEAHGRQTEDYLREHFDFNPTPQERAELEAEHAAIMAGLTPSSSPAAVHGEPARDRN